MPVPTPDLVWLTANEVVDCVCEALSEQSSCGCPCRAGVVYGAPAWDNCCDGQLTVFVERIYVQSEFPQTMTGEIICSSPLAADMSLQLLRCAPVLDDDGSAPSIAVLSEHAAQMLQDWYITQRALICCLATYRKYRAFTLRDSRPVGPQGGCSGFEIRFTVQLVDPIPVI